MADLLKVRENVRSMIDQGAPRAHIDRYLELEKVTPEQLRAFRVSPTAVGGQIPEPINPLGPTPGERAAGMGAALAQGASFGLADEGAAALRSAATGEPYSAALERQRTLPAMAGPARVPLEIAGGILQGGLMAAPRTLAGAGGMGALEGALYAAGTAEGGAEERAKAAAGGALIGGPMAAVGRQLLRGLTSYRARRKQGLSRAQIAAYDEIIGRLQRNDITPRQAAARITTLGDEGVLADVPVLRPLAQQVAAETDVGRRIATDVLERRASQGAARVNRALDIAFDLGDDPRAFSQRITRSLAEEGGPLYERARAVPDLEMTESLEAALEQPAVRNAIRNLRGTVTWRDVPTGNMALLDMAYKTVGERARGQGAAKSALKTARDDLMNAIAEQNPLYREAVENWATTKANQDAFAEGRKALNADVEDVTTALAGYNPAERSSYVAGLARAALRSTAGEGRTAAGNVRNLLRGERGMILEAALGQDAWRAFRGRLLRELEYADTLNTVLRGSPTEPRQAAARERTQQAGRLLRAAQSLRSGNIPGAVLEVGIPSGTPAGRVASERAAAQALFRGQEAVPNIVDRADFLRGVNRDMQRAVPPMLGGVGVTSGILGEGMF